MAERILILGGYGTFGGRLAQLLAGEEGLTLVVAGRSRELPAAPWRHARHFGCKIALPDSTVTEISRLVPSAETAYEAQVAQRAG
jgi:uncharacterized protein YbjT (DUF2867 family)